MALSFGRGKKGESDDAASNAAPNVAPQAGASTSAATEGLDESWFEGAFDEESATPQTAPAPVPSAYVAPPATAPDSDFDMFANLENPGKQPIKSASFDMEDAAPQMASSADAEGLTPFDATATSAKSKGGLKKILPLLIGLVVLGGGGYFWISQQSSDSDETDATAPSVTRPAPVTRPGDTTPPAVNVVRPPDVTPTGKIPPITASDAKVKAQLQKLWDEGAMAKKAGKTADARKKWQEAVKLGNSNPGTKQSAKMIQDAIDKLK